MTKFGIGQPVRRVEDQRFVTGRGRFVDDMNLPHQAYGAVVLAPHAHARITRIDTARARAADGVLCVLTGADAIADGLDGFPPLFMPEDWGGPKGYRTVRPVLVTDKVRCVGDRVAFVVASTLDQARDAAEAIEIDYQPLPAVVHVEDAVADGAPAIWDDCAGNVSFELAHGDKAATEAVFSKASHVVSLRLENNRISANSIEARAAIGDYDPGDESFTLHTSSQNPHGVREVMAQSVFGLPETRFRVIAPDVGGGFGLKTNPHPEDALVLWASKRCGRPVKWISTRSEGLIGDNHARDQIVHGEMALDGDGRILAIRARALHAMGAYIFSSGVSPVDMALRFIPNLYDVATIDVSTRAVFTNTSTLAAYRGAGRPEAVYLTERLLDRAAREMGIDPVEIRRRNFVKPDAMPYEMPTGFIYDSGEFERLLDKCLADADWAGFTKRRTASEQAGKLRGRAVTSYIEQGGRFNDRMELRFDPGGTVTIVAGTFSHGQGHATTYAQMVTDWLGVPFESIRFIQGDTDKVPFGRGTFAARSSMIGGCALKAAADTIVEKATPVAAHLMEVTPADMEFADGMFRIAGTDRSIPLMEVASAFYGKTGPPSMFGVGLEASGSYGMDAPTHPANYPNGCHCCELEVDPETGVVTIDRYTVVDDVGRVINPMICEGQVQGGLAQGIGQALMENVAYDRDTGQLLSGSFMDYGMPRGDDLPMFTLSFEEILSTTNPLGIKGVGEAGAIGSPPAVINALLDALAPLGVDHIDMPATPLRLWQAIHLARSAG